MISTEKQFRIRWFSIYKIMFSISWTKINSLNLSRSSFYVYVLPLNKALEDKKEIMDRLLGGDRLMPDITEADKPLRLGRCNIQGTS